MNVHKVFLFFIFIGSLLALVDSNIRFSDETSTFVEQRDGVLEVLYNGKWGTICNFGFDILSASIACFMMGYPPRGVPIINNKHRSNLTTILSNFNCSGRVILPDSNFNAAAINISLCVFSENIPFDCNDYNRQTSILCLDNMKIPETTTLTPNYKPILPVNCSNPTNSSLRLVNGTNHGGRVEILHPDTNIWGTICADGFDVHAARTLCRMLCTSSDNLEYAFPILYRYGIAPESIPIHLARIQCPQNASNLKECSLGDGWGSVHGCTHQLDIGIQCGPPLISETIAEYSPEFSCNQTSAHIRYNKTQNPDLEPSMIKLNGDIPAGCKFSVLDQGSFIEVDVPLVGCGGSFSLSNISSMVITFNMTRDFSIPTTGIISHLPIHFSVTCLILRNSQIQSAAIDSPIVTKNLADSSQTLYSSIHFYRNELFTERLARPFNIRPEQTTYILVSLLNGQPTSKLILENCWVTSNQDRNSVLRRYLIKERCATLDRLTVIPITNTKVGFSFPIFFLGIANDKVSNSNKLYVHCDIRICDSSERSAYCQPYCIPHATPNKIESKSRRHAPTAKFVQIADSDVKIMDDNKL